MIGWERRKLQKNWLNYRKARLGRSGYREVLVKPQLKGFLSTLRKDTPLSASEPLRILDFGCGEGRFIGETVSELSQENNLSNFHLSGLDIVDSFLESYKANIPGASTLNTDLSHSLLTHQECQEIIEKLGGTFDALISIFTMHNIKQLSVAVSNLNGLIKTDGYLLSIVLDPDFALWLLSESSLRNVMDGIDSDYCFEAEYPIVATDIKNKFYVPYYHRRRSDYRRIFAEYDIRFVKLKPKSSDSRAVINHLYKGTLYYPRILFHSSSLAIIGRRRSGHG